MAVEVRLPGALATVTDGVRRVALDPIADNSVADILDALGRRWPRLDGRLRDETGQLRRFVNVYVDGEDVRATGGLATPVPDGGVVFIVPSVAGG